MDISKMLQRIRAAVWLTWKEQSNWTRLPYYILYTLITPFFQIIVYAYIYIVVALYSGLVDQAMAYYLVSGVSLYNFIGSGLYGLIWTIHVEREHFRTLKYTYIGFPSLQLYLFSRGIYHYITGIVTTLVMLISGLILTGYPICTINMNIPLLIFLIVIGLIWSSQLGIMVAGTSIFSSEYGPLISEAVGGILFLLGAVLYPISSLPKYIQPFAEIFPMMEWIELMRHFINLSYPLLGFDVLIIKLVLKTALYVIVAYVFFKITENIARRKGFLEATLHH